jgi:hypothetical protein
MVCRLPEWRPDMEFLRSDPEDFRIATRMRGINDPENAAFAPVCSPTPGEASPGSKCALPLLVSPDSQAMRSAPPGAVTTLAHERVARTRDSLRSLLDAFSGLEIMDLLPGFGAERSATDDVLAGFTESNAGAVIASLESWAAAHPTRAFEVALLVPPLRELARALGLVPR